MVSTPSKTEELSFTKNLTPVRFLDSPKTKIASCDSNVAACKSRLESLVKSIEDNFNKWLLAEKRGLALCNSIEAIKTNQYEKSNANTNSIEHTLYPKEIKLYCDKLAIIASIFDDITRNAKESLRQLKALAKLPGSCNEVFYRSWQLSEFIDFLAELTERYDMEAKVKMYIAENLPHCLTRSDLIRCTSAWEYPQYVDSYVQLMFTFFKEEIKHRKYLYCFINLFYKTLKFRHKKKNNKHKALKQYIKDYQNLVYIKKLLKMHSSKATYLFEEGYIIIFDRQPKQ